MAIVINSGQFISRIALGITPTGVSGVPAGGTVDISTFPNVTGFFANGCALTNIIGIDGQSRFRAIDVSNNRLAIPCPSIAQNSGLFSFQASNAGFTGTVPNFGNNGLLAQAHYGNNRGLSGEFPTITGLTGLQQLYLNASSFSGAAPILAASNRELRIFWYNNNRFTGSIPQWPSGSHLLRDFNCGNNQLTGFVPNFFSNGAMRIGAFANNLLTDFTGRFPSNISGLSFNFAANRLTPNAISGILQELVNSNSRTGGLAIQAGSNARVTGAVDLSNLATLSGRGWSITFNP